MAARNERRASGLEKFRRVRVELPDTHGVLRGKVVASGKAASSHGLRFCDAFFGLSVDDDFTHNRFTSPQTGFEDFVAVPDLDTVRPIPWEEGAGAVLADLRTKDGEPHPLCQREAVRRATRRAEAAGYSAKVALEFESRRPRRAAGARRAPLRGPPAPLAPPTGVQLPAMARFRPLRRSAPRRPPSIRRRARVHPHRARLRRTGGVAEALAAARCDRRRRPLQVRLQGDRNSPRPGRHLHGQVEP